MNQKFKQGNQGERMWINYISKDHSNIQKAPNKRFYDWDIKANWNSNKVTYEVKYDSSAYHYAQKYNRDVNIYIEYKNTNEDADSGILMSKADFYVYIIKTPNKEGGNNNIAYVFNRDELIKVIGENGFPKAGNKKGGDNNALGYKIPLKELKSITKAVIDVDKHILL